MESSTQRLREIEDHLCSAFEVYPTDGIISHAPTGERYVNYCSAGSKTEGFATKSYSSENEAIDEYARTVSDIIKIANRWKIRKRVLYWRKRPRMIINGEHSHFVSSRFLISAKRVI